MKKQFPPSSSLSNEQPETASPAPGRETADIGAKTTPRMASAAIFNGAIEVEIDHNGTLYRLRQTSMGKLILTK